MPLTFGGFVVAVDKQTSENSGAKSNDHFEKGRV